MSPSTGEQREFHFGVPGVDGQGGRFGQIKVFADYDTPVYPSFITLTNLVVANAAPDPGGGTIEIASALHFTLSNSIVGPVCCGWRGSASDDVAEMVIGNRLNMQVSDHVLVSGNVFQGEAHTASYWPASLGPIPQPDDPGPHTDAVHAVGGSNLTFTNNKFYNSQTQALFFESIQGSVTNVTVVGNYIDSLAGCGVCLNTGGGGGGNWLIAFNTSNVGFGFGAGTYQPARRFP